MAADRSYVAENRAQLAANAAAGGPISVRRAEHRREHLDEIDQNLARR